MLKTYKNDIDTALKNLLNEARKNHNLTSPSGYLLSGIKDFVLRKGKRIRPLLFIAGFEGYIKDKKYSRKDLIRSSLSVELLHDFLLIHDDIIDKSDLRRGKPTLHKYFNKKLRLPNEHEIGPSLSIIAGDIVFALAVEALGTLAASPKRKERALKKLIKATISTGTGEYIDVVNNVTSLEKVSKNDVFNVYTLKTAEYTFEAPLVIGALLAGTGEEELSKLSKFGMLLGKAFQIQDDLLDLFASSDIIGKPVLSDLDESKKTLPVWKAYSKLDRKQKNKLKSIFNKNKKTMSDLKTVRSLIKSTDADKYCLKMVSSLLNDANDIFEDLKIKPKCKKVLKEFVDNFFGKMELLSTIIGSPLSL